MKLLNNAELEALSIDGNAYWQDKSQRDAIDKADPINRQTVKDAYDQAMIDLQTIIDQVNPTNAQVIWAVKRLAVITKNVYLYHKSEIG